MESSTGGQWNGNLAISGIDDDAIIENDHTDDIPVTLLNPESNLAMGYPTGQCATNNTVVASDGSQAKEFYLKHAASGQFEIHSKECPELLVELAGSCQNKAAIRLSGAIRKVKIQLEGTNYLHMREVQVLDYHDVNVAQNRPATQSSNMTGPDAAAVAGRAVDGNLTTYSHTNNQIGKWPSFIFKLGITLSPLTLFVNF